MCVSLVHLDEQYGMFAPSQAGLRDGEGPSLIPAATRHEGQTVASSATFRISHPMAASRRANVINETRSIRRRASVMPAAAPSLSQTARDNPVYRALAWLTASRPQLWDDIEAMRSLKYRRVLRRLSFLWSIKEHP